jgi:hypothetical protein
MNTNNFYQPTTEYNNWETDYDEDDYYYEEDQQHDYDEQQDYEQQEYENQPESDIEDMEDEFDDDEYYRLPNAHRQCNQEEINMHNMMKTQKYQRSEINYDIENTPDAPWIDFEEEVDTLKISTAQKKKTKGKPNAWASKGKVVSFFDQVSKHQQKIRDEKKLLPDAIEKEKMLIEERRQTKKNLFRSVACKFSWDKRNHCFSSKHRCKNTDTKHRCMYAHTHKEVRPAICMYDRLCKNPSCLRLHSVTKDICNCGENGSSRFHKIICTCERRFETPKEYRARTGFNYTGDPFTKTHGVKLFEPSSKKSQDLVETFKVPSTITERKQKKYMEWKKRSENIPSNPVVKMTSLKFTKLHAGKVVPTKGGKVKSIIGEVKQKNKKKKNSVEIVETEANRKLREDRERRIKLVEQKRQQMKEEYDARLTDDCDYFDDYTDDY